MLAESGDPAGPLCSACRDAVWAHLSEELEWSVAELGTSAEVDSLRSGILRVSCGSAGCVNAGLRSEKPVVFVSALRAGHLVCSRVLWKDSHAVHCPWL